MIEPRAKVVGTGNLTVFYVSTPIGTELTTVADVLSVLREDRSYDARIAALKAFNQARKTGDIDDGLDAAWNAMLDQFEKEQSE